MADRPRADGTTSSHAPSSGAARAQTLSRQPLFWQVVAFTAVYLIWGSTYLAIRVAVRSLPPFLMAGCRFVTAGTILFVILRAHGCARPTRIEWARGAIAGVLMLTGGNGLVTWAEEWVPSNLTALLIAAVPLHMAVLDWLRPGGTPPRRQVSIGIGIGLVGMILLASSSASPARGGNPLAVAAVLLSGVCWAVGSLYSRYGGMHPHPLMAAAQQMIAGGIALLAVGIGHGEVARFHGANVSATSIAAFGYLTVFGSLVAFSAFGWLVQVTSPARLSTISYVNPVVAVIVGWAILGETMAPRALAGAALIICAVAAMTWGLRPRASRS